MFEKMEIMRTAHAMAVHAAERQAVVARNIANADTPGYRAREIAEFSIASSRQAGQTLRVSRSGHIATAPANAQAFRIIDAPGAASPNGNSVTLETELLKSVEAGRQHNLALAIYSSSLNILRTSIGRR